MNSVQFASQSWKDLKKDFVDRGKLHSVFTRPLKVSRGTTLPQKFEPLLLSIHIDKLEDLCEKCMALRREIRELEILAVKSIMDYELFLKTSVIDEESETIRLLQDSKAAEKLSLDAAATAFGNSPALNNGFSLTSAGRSKALDKELKGITRLKDLIKERWADVRSYQQAYYARYTEPGNAHNYGQRAENLHTILQKELAEALDRAAALDLGLKTIYGWSGGELPKEVDLATLDNFVIWVLEARRQIAWRAEKETCFDVVIPLVQPWSGGKYGLIRKAKFDDAIAASTSDPISLRFDIDPKIFRDQDVRLKGIGLSFGNKFGLVIESGIDRIQTADEFAKLSAFVVTPEQTSADGTKYRRPNINLGNIGLHDSAQPLAFVEGIAVTNINPIGSWEILIHPWMVWKEADELKLSEGVGGERIKDLKLTLRAYVPGKQS
jgi:hypothetical protein